MTDGEWRKVLKLLLPTLIALLVLIVILHYVQGKIDIIMSQYDPELTTTILGSTKKWFW